jgi:hypothetical protein
MVYRNAGAGRWAYIAAGLPSTTDSSTYTLAVSSKKKRPAGAP